MNWIESIQKTIHYMEEHLLEDISVEDISAQAHISPFHFQRTFALLTDITVGEYLRRRRLTLAAYELLNSTSKIINLAEKYGYDTPESFSKAFRRQHGIAPSEARKNRNHLKAYNRLVIQVSLKGAEPMNYKIVEQTSLTFVGIKRTFSYENGENLREIPNMWKDAYADGTEDRLFQLNNGEISGVVGVCVDQTEVQNQQMEYWIATAYHGEVPEGLSQLEVPASKWSVFEVDGPLPDAIQELWRQIISEWFPSNPYEHARIPELEVYAGNGASPQIWIPVK